MAHARMTLLDIAKRNASDALVGLIDEAAVAHPEWLLGEARTIEGTQYKTLVRTALPDVGFRRANEGVETKKSTLVNRLVECFIVDASWDMDKAVADASEDGAEAVCAEEAGAHMEGAITNLCKQFYYGTASGAAGAAYGYAGLIDMVDSGMVIDAGGTTDNTCSSVWAVKFGPKYARWVMGGGGDWNEGEIVSLPVTVSSKQMWSYAQELVGWMGLQIGHKQSIARLHSATADSGKGVTDAQIALLLEKFPVGIVPDVLLMNRRSLRQLQSSRTATNPTGAPAPFPQDSFGIPIAVTDSIISTEALG
ncbi:MAG TPA: hypothetical protein VM238_07755 [Phycisphaerae bacterium]|nr:hypothetical protein [Phycisphaerae bacterium]HUW99744.1 hypothetical protein [Phycisphaerae bacterium]